MLILDSMAVDEPFELWSIKNLVIAMAVFRAWAHPTSKCNEVCFLSRSDCLAVLQLTHVFLELRYFPDLELLELVTEQED